jgi:hypothetical protein
MQKSSFIVRNSSLSVIMKSRRRGSYVSYLSYCRNTLVKIKDMVTYGYKRWGTRTDRAQLKENNERVIKK